MLRATNRTAHDAVPVNVNDPVNDKVKFVLYLFVIQQWESAIMGINKGLFCTWVVTLTERMTKGSIKSAGSKQPELIRVAFNNNSSRANSIQKRMMSCSTPVFPMVNLMNDAFGGGSLLNDGIPLTIVLEPADDEEHMAA